MRVALGARMRVLYIFLWVGVLGKMLQSAAFAAPVFGEAVEKGGWMIVPDHASTSVYYALPKVIDVARAPWDPRPESGGSFLREKINRHLYRFEFALSSKPMPPLDSERSVMRALPCNTAGVEIHNLVGSQALSMNFVPGPQWGVPAVQKVVIEMGVKKNLEQFLLAMGVQGTIKLVCEGFEKRPQHVEEAPSEMMLGVPIDARFSHWFYR